MSIKHQLTDAQRRTLAELDKRGEAMATLIDGRLAVILPPVGNSVEAQGAALRKLWVAMQSIRFTE